MNGKKIFRDIGRTKNIKYRLFYLIKPPGWSHDGSSKTTKELQSGTGTATTAIPYDSKKTPAPRHLLTGLITLLFITASSQERKLLYDITRNGNVIGKVELLESVRGAKKFLSFTSDVKTKFIVSFCDHAYETALFDQGLMIYSSFSQKQNGSIKASKTTTAAGTGYRIADNGNLKQLITDRIVYNTLLLYTNEPENISRVYSDNHQKHLDIKKIATGKYRLTLPDGNYNYYSYEDGICKRVDIERTLFTVHFILKENKL